ncbi:MAG TPA: sugar phosphate isomerase/epimerase [Gemmatimonadales bacterium]|nr:sugar phosphate isomerase/epimerase [Gemmatimonadales bacterium]
MERREFLSTSGALALGVMLPPACRMARGAKIDKIGVQLYTVRDQMKADFEGTLARIAQIGYKEVEFAGYYDRSPADVRAILERNGLTAPATHMMSDNTEGWKKAIDLAKSVGHNYLVAPWIPEEKRKTLDDWKRIGDEFNRVGQMAKDAGIQFAYHNHDFEFQPRIEGRIPFDVLLENTDAKLVQLEVDLYWITKGGQDPLAYFQRWPGRVPLVHVKDSMGGPEHKMVDVGQGKIEWKRIFAKREQAGIKHFFVEHDQPPQPFDGIAMSYTYLKNLEF